MRFVYDLLYYEKENQPPPAYSSFLFPYFSFSPIYKCHTFLVSESGVRYNCIVARPGRFINNF